MLGKKIYSLLAAAIVVAMCSVAANATTVYCVCPGGQPYLYSFNGTTNNGFTTMESCTIEGLEGLPCYSCEYNSSYPSLIFVNTNSWNNQTQTADITSYSAASDGNYYFFFAYSEGVYYNLTSTTSGTASGQAFMSDGNGWGSSGASLNSTSYSNVYSADVTLSSSITKYLVCSHDENYSNKVGTSSTVYVDTQYTLSSSVTTDGVCSISSGDYTAYYISDNVTGGGYLYITEASSSSSDDSVDDDSDNDGDDTDTSSSSYDVRLTGGGNSWANYSSTCCFTDSGDGQTFTYSFTEGAPYTWSGQEFKIVDYTSGESSPAWYSLNYTAVVLGTQSSIFQSNYNSYMPTLTSGTSYTITVTFLGSEYPGSQHNEIYILIEATSSSSGDSDGDTTSSTTSDYYTIYIHDTGTSGYYLYAWGTESESEMVYYLADGTYSTNNNWPGFDFSNLPTTFVDDVEYYYLQISSSLSNIGALITDSSENKYTDNISVTGDVYILIDGSTVSQTQPTASSLTSSSGTATDVSDYGYFYITGDWNELNGKWLPNPYGLFSKNEDEETKDIYSLVATIYNFSGKFKVLGTESSDKQYHVESGCAWLTSTSGVLALDTKYTLADNNTNTLISSNMLIADETTSYSKLIFYFNPSDGAFMITKDSLTEDEESAYEYKYYLATSFNDYYNGRTSESSSTDGDDDDSTTSANTVTIKVYLGDNSSSFLANGDGNAYIYSWYYTEAGVKVEELGAWPGTALDVTEGYATLTLERKASANFIINNGLGGGANGENQTHDIVLGNYSGTVTITIGSQDATYFSSDGSTAYYYSHTVSATPSSEISFYMVPDEASVPYLYVWDTSTSGAVSSVWPGTQFSEIVEVSGHYLYKLTYNSVSNPLGAIISDGTTDNGYDKTVDITSILADVYLDWLNDQNENQESGIGKYWNDTYNTVALISVDQSTEEESLSKYTLDENTPYLFKMVAISDLMDSEQDAATYTDANGNEKKYDVQSEAWYTVIYDITGEDEAEIANTNATDLNNTESCYTIDVIDGSKYNFDESTDFYVIASNAHGDLVKYSTGGSVGYSQYLTYSTGNGNTTLSTPSTMYEEDDNGGSKYSYAFFVVETQNVTSTTTSAAARSNVKTATATTDGSYAVVGGGSTLNVMVYLATEEGVETGINKVDSEGNVIVAERYFRLDGIEVAEPSTDNRQIYVILRTYDDGSVKAFKEVR